MLSRDRWLADVAGARRWREMEGVTVGALISQRTLHAHSSLPRGSDQRSRVLSDSRSAARQSPSPYRTGEVVMRQDGEIE